MKKKIIFSTIPAVLFLVYLFNFTSVEFGDYDSINEAVAKGVIYKEKTILDVVQKNDVAIVLYQTMVKSNVQEHEVIAVAFFTGNDKKGWKKHGTDSWEWNLEANFSAYQKMYFSEKSSLRVYFGEINNKDIHSIQMKNQLNNKFINAKLIEGNNQRFYLIIGEGSDILALDVNGNVIEQKQV